VGGRQSLKPHGRRVRKSHQFVMERGPAGPTRGAKQVLPGGGDLGDEIAYEALPDFIVVLWVDMRVAQIVSAARVQA